MAKLHFKTGIYKITNLLSHKVYIGKSKNIEKRFERHKSPSYRKEKNQAIHQAIDKYGIENFTFEIIEECEINTLNEKEIYWIQHYDSYNSGYNCTLGGDGGIVTSILTEDEVKSIWKLKNSTTPIKEIANNFGVSKACIDDIYSGRTWGHLKPESPQRKKRSVFTQEEEEYIVNQTLGGTKPKQLFEEMKLEGRYKLGSLRNKMRKIKEENING